MNRAARAHVQGLWVGIQTHRSSVANHEVRHRKACMRPCANRSATAVLEGHRARQWVPRCKVLGERSGIGRRAAKPLT